MYRMEKVGVYAGMGKWFLGRNWIEDVEKGS
jgi:hypothetical protein